MLLARPLAFIFAISAVPAYTATPSTVATGAEFAGGARERYGAWKMGENVNYVYAAETGAQSQMHVTLQPAVSTTQPLFLHIRGRDDDAAAACPIRILVNEKVIFEGPSGFPSDKWETRKFPVPASASTSYTVSIQNVETAGKTGMPPWFMVARCALAPENFDLSSRGMSDFKISLPAEKREHPEPLSAGAKPGFAWRGTKGWLWKPEQYLSEIPYLAKYRMNFLMNCYGSMCDIENVPFGDPRCNRWYEPLPEAKKRAYEKVVRACQHQDVTFCFSMNPNLSSNRYVNSGKPEDVDALWLHYEWMQGLGVKWFNISLDDITTGIDAVGQAKVVNEILRRLRAKDPDVQMIFCPTYYWGDGTEKDQKPYLEALARELDEDVYLFWTGDAVVGPITRKAADTFRSIGKRRIFLWDNYPVNDGKPTMHLGPVMNRAPDLNAVVDGYMANPLHTQTEANRIPLLTCADYAWNPAAYDPQRSIEQAILHLEDSDEKRRVLAELTEAYAGFLVWQRPDTGFNSVREQFQKIVSAPHAHQAALAWANHISAVGDRMAKSFPNRYTAEKQTITADVKWMQDELRNRYGH